MNTATINPLDEIVNPSGEDIVLFNEAGKVRFRTIASLFGKISARGWSYAEEWDQLGILMLSTTYFNDVKFADGR